MKRDYLLQKDVDYISEILETALDEKLLSNLTFRVIIIDRKNIINLYKIIVETFNVYVEHILFANPNTNNGTKIKKLSELPDNFKYPWLHGNILLKDNIKVNFDISYIEDNTNELIIGLSYNLFNPEIYILDETNQNLKKIKNPYYKEYKAKLDQLINFLKQEFKKQNIEYTVIADSAESFKPKNMTSKEYQELLKSRVSKG